MRQVLQNLRTGVVEVADIPAVSCGPGQLLIVTRCSLISAGTERMLVDFGRAGWLSKARQQPEKVRQVLDKIRTDGLLPTLEAVKSKLDQPIPLGYCNVGVVQEVGARVSGFRRGDRVVSNGPHAEVVAVPKNLCARIPDAVADEDAVFTVLGAIALQGIRLLEPTLGECFVVTGLGLIGQMAVQILQAHGCRVLGLDVDATRCQLAESFGAKALHLGSGADPVATAMRFSRARGVDGVLITAATRSNEPVAQAARMCRKRGRIVLTGVTGLELNRSDFYEKELSFQVSCSYGPGRYDSEYEDRGHDYPVGYVRWTEQRNFEAVLDLMDAGKLNVRPLITHRFPIDKAPGAYALISENREPYMGIILDYEPQSEEALRPKSTILLQEEPRHQSHTEAKPAVGFIGAGSFATRILAPAVAKTGAKLKTVSSASGVSGTHLGRKLGFERSTTDNREILEDPTIAAVFITTRHNTHGPLVLKALRAGKHVFVEKPLCLTIAELDAISEALAQSTSKHPLLMVGFNRRFAPHIRKIKSLLHPLDNPKSIIMTVNAGAIPGDHWIQDPQVGGGRIIGEACHFVDLMRYLTGHRITAYSAWPMKSPCNDTVVIQLGFEDGSIATIHYLSNGHRRFPKERLEIFVEGRIIQLDNFRKLRAYGWPSFKKMNLWRQDKGHVAEVAEFINAVQKGLSSPIPYDEIEEVSRICIDLDRQVRG